MKQIHNNNSSSDEVNIEYLQEETTDYEEFMPWKNSFVGDRFFQWVKEKFYDFEENQIQIDKEIFFFKNESTFAFRINAEVIDINPHHIWNYWKDLIIDTGYILKNSESIYKDRLNTLRYYLKPKLKYKLERDQLYGNITLELIKNGGMPKYILFKCTWYQDSGFNDAEEYKLLMEHLIN